MAQTSVKGQIVTKNDAGRQKVTSISNVNPEASMETLAEALTLYGGLMEEAPVEFRRQETNVVEV